MSQALFDQAVKALGENRFSEARKILIELRQTGVTSADLESNLALALLKTGDPGWAVYHAERALGLDRWNLDRWKELEKINSAVFELGATSLSPVDSWIHSSSRLLKSTESAFIGLNLGLALAFLAINKRITKIRLLVLGSPTLLALGYAAFLATGFQVAVTPKESALRRAPLESSSPQGLLKPGTRLEILRASGDFYEVKNRQYSGWVLKKDTEKLP